MPERHDLEALATAMLTPKRRPVADPASHWETSATLATPNGDIAYHTAGTGPTVLLIHGWEASHHDLDAFVGPLRAHGYRAAALDLPAHGASTGGTASIPECGEAVRALAERLGAIHAIVGHSAGCPIATYAMLHGVKAERAVLIATPERYERYARWFAEEAGVDAGDLIATLKARGLDVDSMVLTDNAAQLDVPALIVHSADDRTTSVEGARRVARAWRDSEFLEVDGLGHSRILRDPAVIDRVIAFIETP